MIVGLVLSSSRVWLPVCDRQGQNQDWILVNHEMPKVGDHQVDW